MMIDAHIHFDQYSSDEQNEILANLNNVKALISVSFDLNSCQKNLELSLLDSRIKPAFGFHPEQEIPTVGIDEILRFMESNIHNMVAVGEVGLPYYRKLEHPSVDYGPYIQLLERFIVFAVKWDKPIVLHAVYEDAEIACDLLEKHGVKKAHFHWYKGDVTRLIDNGYFISITPDVCYEEEIGQLVQQFPIEQMMIETDGPWPFEGPFTGKMTEPNMMKQSIEKIAEIKDLPVEEVTKRLFENTKKFYKI